jgi:hypothetical protein
MEKEKKGKERSKMPLDIIVTPVYNEMPFEMQVTLFYSRLADAVRI